MRRLIAVFFLLTSLGAGAADLSRPVTLVASPAVQGAYAQTVLVAVPARGLHLGFIVNRPTGVSLAELFPSHAPAAKVAEPVYFGGPEMSDAIFAVVDGNPGAGAWQLVERLFVASDEQTIDRIIERTPNDARYFAGFVGWQPGELAEEVKAGFWYVLPADAMVLRRDPHGLWEALVERAGNGHPVPRGLTPTSFTGGER
jgi:putative transcriptional regulator